MKNTNLVSKFCNVLVKPCEETFHQIHGYFIKTVREIIVLDLIYEEKYSSCAAFKIRVGWCYYSISHPIAEHKTQVNSRGQHTISNTISVYVHMETCCAVCPEANNIIHSSECFSQIYTYVSVN